jgi:heme exporter protein C
MPRGRRAVSLATLVAGACLLLVGVLGVPIVHQSVVWWRTLHLGPTVVRADGGAGMPPAMLQALLVSLLAFTLLYAYLLSQRMALGRAEDAIARMRAQRDLRAGGARDR